MATPSKPNPKPADQHFPAPKQMRTASPTPKPTPPARQQQQPGQQQRPQQQRPADEQQEYDQGEQQNAAGIHAASLGAHHGVLLDAIVHALADAVARWLGTDPETLKQMVAARQQGGDENQGEQHQEYDQDGE